MVSRVFAEMAAVWQPPCPRDGGDVARIASSSISCGTPTTPSSAPSKIGRSNGRRLDRAYASVRSRLTPQAYRTVKEPLESEGDSLGSISGRSTACWRGTTRDTRPCSGAAAGPVAGRKVDARARTALPQAVAELRAARNVHGGARGLRARGRPAPSRRRSRRARGPEPAGRALVGVLLPGDEPRAAAVRQIFPEPAKRHEHGARHADEEVDVRDAPDPPREEAA